MKDETLNITSFYLNCAVNYFTVTGEQVFNLLGNVYKNWSQMLEFKG